MSKKKVRKAKRQAAPVQTTGTADIVASSQNSRREKRRQTKSQQKLPSKITEVDQLRDEYAYVLKDLRLIFAIAAVMFLILFGLNIFLS